MLIKHAQKLSKQSREETYELCGLTVAARFENGRKSYAFPVVPAMIAGISLLDGIILTVPSSPEWSAACIGGAALTLYVRGD